MLLRSHIHIHAHAYIFFPLLLTIFFLLLLLLLLLASQTHTTTPSPRNHAQAHNPQLPPIIVLTPTSSPTYTSLLLSNLPNPIHALPLPNASLIDDRAFPQGNHQPLSPADRSAWRAHMNAMRFVIEQGLDTALILPDDFRSSEHLLPRVQSVLPGEWDVMVLQNPTDGFVYAVTRAGARKVLYEHGMRNFDGEFGGALRAWCRGETRNMGERPRCVDSGGVGIGKRGD